MISDEDLEKEMLDDLDYLYQTYRKQVEEGKTSVKSLNIVIRALKAVHAYFMIGETTPTLPELPDTENNEEEHF